MVKIGSARINERNSISNGKAGDQTGGEVSTQNWYLHSKGWVVIRPKSKDHAEKIAQCMESACANNHIGYDQSQRNTLYTEAQKYGFDCTKVTKDVETDCSALVRVCCKYAGINVGDFNTASERTALMNTGKFKVKTADKFCKQSDYLKRGDILVTKTKGHTVVVLSNGAKIKEKKALKKIADISHYHPVTDWKKVKSNVEFLISKATQGTKNVDSTLMSFVEGCEKNKIPYWLYTYLNKGNEVEQAKYMVSKCEPLVGKYFVGYILDVEDGNLPVNVKGALDYLNGLGYKTMLYTGYADYNKYKGVITNRGKNCAFWEARYGRNTGTYSAIYHPHSTADLHQFTSSGKVDGIRGSVDLNRLTGKKSLEWFTIPLAKEKQGFYKKYTGTSEKIDTVLKAVGVPEDYIGSWKKRKPVALANGIPGYEGTAEQNKRLIALAKAGKLKKA